MCQNSIKIHIKFDLCAKFTVSDVKIQWSDEIQILHPLLFFFATGESEDTPIMVTCTSWWTLFWPMKLSA